jgi:hypothetical protein
MIEKIRKTWSKPAQVHDEAHKRTIRDLDQKAKACEHKRMQRNETIYAQNLVYFEFLP